MKLAEKWFRNAAQRGDSYAQLNLGQMYSVGVGVEKNEKLAVEWVGKAAEQGDAEAQYLLGGKYISGKGVPIDPALCTHWMKRAAEQDHPDAQKMLGMSYQLGIGVPESDSAAIDWYYKAGENFLRRKQRDEALLCYDKLRLVDPQHPLTRKLRDRLYAGELAPNDPPVAAKQVVLARTGTGWPTGEGFVVTAHHVVSGARAIRLVAIDGVETVATLAAKDAANDLALLRVSEPQKLPPALPIAAKSARIGERVFTVGYPLADLMGGRPKLTEGIVNAVTGFGDDPRAIQISATLHAGNSGGPVVNMRGEIVGVALAKLNAVNVFKWTGNLPENVGYAVKISYLEPLTSALPENIARPVVLGAEAAELPDLAKRVQGSVLLVVAE